MQRLLWVGLSGLLLAAASGCTPWRAQEYYARLESAEDNAATARLRADQVCYRLDRVERTADEALRRADDAQAQVRQLRQALRK
ncbi:MULTISPECIES: hypothetical protein [unclassified Pseudomonas]|uniref:hypothetical protein n=1 Tax=unclassified Pseudomonas TaxID=196821 RepID=UPI000A1E2683|nr:MULTISPECIES: hypothetical protein [unclassified Pseudomonas]